MVITEFDAGDPDATMHALADEILRYRLALRQLARAIGLAEAGAPFGVLSPGPLWRPRRASKGDVVPPAAYVKGAAVCCGVCWRATADEDGHYSFAVAL
jgi:hypothetical protein